MEYGQDIPTKLRKPFGLIVLLLRHFINSIASIEQIFIPSLWLMQVDITPATCLYILLPMQLISPTCSTINPPDRPLASFEFSWTNGKMLVALWGLFIISAGKQYFTLLLHREKNIRKGGARRNWTLPCFSIRIAHLWANSFQYCLTSNFEWLEWRHFSFLSFNLLFQFCKWDRYWLWESSYRE